MLADVDAGSDTPSLIGKVLKWKAADGASGSSRLSLAARFRFAFDSRFRFAVAAEMLWKTLSNANDALAVMFDTLNAMAQMDPPAYKEALTAIATRKAGDVSRLAATPFPSLPCHPTHLLFTSLSSGSLSPPLSKKPTRSSTSFRAHARRLSFVPFSPSFPRFFSFLLVPPRLPLIPTSALADYPLPYETHGRPFFRPHRA